MGCFLISFCLGNTAFPFADRLVADVQPLGQLALGQPMLVAQGGNQGAGFFRLYHLNLLSHTPIIAHRALLRNRRCVERRGAEKNLPQGEGKVFLLPGYQSSMMSTMMRMAVRQPQPSALPEELPPEEPLL